MVFLFFFLRTTTDGIPKESLIQKALSFGNIKIWSFIKLQSVVERLVQDPIPSAIPGNDPLSQKQRSLSKLLANERQFGSAERDPSQKRHDYHYFSKNSYFVLVEDAEQKLATIVAHEYPIERDRDGTERGSWPVLYCHPHSRGPFIEFDERERRRYEKSLRMDAEKTRQQEEQRRKAEIMREKELRRQNQLKARREGDLRRSVSMSNLQRRASMGEPGVNISLVDLDGEASEIHSATPSGYLPSTGHAGYMAASGNSVGVTSTTGTTSTASGPLRGMQLPAVLRKGMQQEIVTSRRSSTMAEPRRRLSLMGPPPDRPQPTLRKSRSTNTMRLPKREEGTKPGYCESCRMRFDDFKEVSVHFFHNTIVSSC
jgi:regulatory subunit for Cdc7p protein kinase